jgi:hypothetical protein
MLRFLRRKSPREPAEAIAAGDYDAALAIYLQRAREDSQNAATWRKKAAEVLAMAGRRSEAIEHYLAAAELLAAQDRMLQVVALYKAVQRLDPDNEIVATKLGEIAASEEERRGQRGDPAGMTIRTRLRSYAPLFSEFSREELTGVVDVMRLHRLPAGARVFGQGDPGDSLFIIVQGEVALTVRGRRSEDEPSEVDRLTEGACFGEVSALSRAPREVSAITTRPSELFELQRDYLDAVAIAHPRIWKVLETFQKSRSIPVGV